MTRHASHPTPATKKNPASQPPARRTVLAVAQALLSLGALEEAHEVLAAIGLLSYSYNGDADTTAEEASAAGVLMQRLHSQLRMDLRLS